MGYVCHIRMNTLITRWFLKLLYLDCFRVIYAQAWHPHNVYNRWNRKRKRGPREDPRVDVVKMQQVAVVCAQGGHFIPGWWMCYPAWVCQKQKYDQTTFWLMVTKVVLPQKTTLILDGRNHLEVTLSYLQEAWHVHSLKRISSPSKWTNRGTFICGVIEWWYTGTDENPAQEYFMGTVHCGCRTDYTGKFYIFPSLDDGAFNSLLFLVMSKAMCARGE